MTIPDEASTDLRSVLEESRTLGFLGPGPIEDHIRHALAFASAFADVPDCVVDLGSGGGIPGLVLAEHWPDSRVILLDGSTRRTAFLETAVLDLGLGPRVEVWSDRAEIVGRDAGRRGIADLVVSRSFGAPPVVAECAAPLLRPGGCLLVSEPPSGDGAEVADRWPAEGLTLLGLRRVRAVEGPPSFVVLRATEPCPERYPRRVGIPAKRPLF